MSTQSPAATPNGKHVPTLDGIAHTGTVHYQLSPAELYEHALRRGDGVVADSGALIVRTGKFTGRSPKDKFVVVCPASKDTVWWGSVNNELPEEKFDRLLLRVQAYLQNRELFVRDCYAGADPDYRLKVRVVNETPWANLFCYNLFLRPDAKELVGFDPEWTILCAPGFHTDPAIDGVKSANATVINFSKRLIVITGSAYTGEMKKGIFTVMNYVLPFKNVLPMHCSANVGKDGDVAIFFGLSGTGKTTLSADPDRNLIGDDEHGWTPDGKVFNFEGGCYAKVIDLSAEKEPQIWNAIKFGSLLENVTFDSHRGVNFADQSITENTRVAYPIHYIDNAQPGSMGGAPQNIFLLTADAFGVLPPISKLTVGQAMYQFLSGYTAKVAGTEAGVKEPQATFSPCYGQAFLPLHPTKYAEMLGEKIRNSNVNVWLINTGWTGGPYGVGSRMKLPYTRAMITAALTGQLNSVEYTTDPVFGLNIPTNVPGVPAEVLNPRNTWGDKAAYDAKANHLAQLFNENFAKYSDFADDEIKAAAPSVRVAV